ncbi:MAG: TVP38/TMEM64 family protein [Gammaproteobacteria bacterium]|nr:TVP38/TMEM64 family protein [Gammaproteobacteria bacterium]
MKGAFVSMWGVIASALFVAVILSVLIYFFDLQSHVVRVLEWLDTLGVWAPALFIVIDMLVVVFLVPGIMVTMGAGFLFGVVNGSLYVVIATTLGATIAFTIARCLLGGSMASYLRTHPRLSLIDEALAGGGWKIVLITRLIPFFPFKLSNYFFGVTQFCTRDFVMGTFLGIWPITVVNVYIGSITADFATLGSPTDSRSQMEWVVYGIGFVISIAFAIYLGHLAQQALRRYAQDD